MATKAEIRTRLADEVFRLDLDEPGGQLDRYIEAAIRHYEHRIFWFNEGDFALSYSAADTHVDLPTGTQSVEAVFDARGVLRERQPVELADWIAAGSVPTQLSDYAREGDRLRLYGVPNVGGSLTFHGFVSAAPLADGDANGWTTDGQDALIARAKLMFCRAITLDVVRAEAAKKELFGDRGTGEAGAEPALLAKNNRMLSGGRPRVASYY